MGSSEGHGDEKGVTKLKQVDRTHQAGVEELTTDTQHLQEAPRRGHWHRFPIDGRFPLPSVILETLEPEPAG